MVLQPGKGHSTVAAPVFKETFLWIYSISTILEKKYYLKHYNPVTSFVEPRM